MEAVLQWVPALLVALLGAFLVWRDPRRLLPGLVLTALLFHLLGTGALALMEWAGTRDPELGAVWVLVGFMGVALASVVVLGVFLIWNTFEMLRREGRRPAALATGAIGALLLAYVVAAVLAVALNSLDLTIWLMFAGLPLGYLGFVFGAFLLYSGAYGWATKRFGKPVAAVVVLGSGLLGGERVSPLLAARLDLGRKLYDRSRAAGLDTVLVPSGGRGDDETLAEAEAMGNYLRGEGVPAEHVLQEDRSTDTRENLEFSAEVMEQARISGDVAVATNNYHAFRAATLMRDVGVPGYAIGARTARYYWPSATVREFLAILRDNLAINVVIIGLLCVPVLWRLASAFAGL